MRHRGIRFSQVVFVSATVGVVVWLNAGSLTPPAGPVSPTMKTLQQVEPRTPVQTLSGNASTQYLISQSGSYYLTDNIVGVSGKHGITIDADNVSLDLRGFTLQGVSGTQHAIFVNCCHHDLSISNGIITQWSGIGIDSGLGTNVLVEKIVSFANGGEGIKVDHGSTLRDCVTHSNIDNGIEVTYACTLSHCVAYENQANGISFLDHCTFLNCEAFSNSGAGFHGETCSPAIQDKGQVTGSAQKSSVGKSSFSVCPSSSTFLNCASNNNGFEGFLVTDNSSFQNCVANHNSGDGFSGSSTNSFSACSAAGNSGDGFRVEDGCAFAGCTSTNNFGGGNGGFGHGFNCFSHCTFAHCTAASNSAPGIESFDHISISDCTMNSNNNIGIYINSGNITNTTVSFNAFEGINVFNGFTTIEGCTISENGGHGVLLKQACKVDNCLVANNGHAGIVIDASDASAQGCQLRNNNIRQNFNDGIVVTSNNLVEGNHCVENGGIGRAGGNGAGILASGSGNRIDANDVVRNDRGVQVTGATNLVIRNSANGNTTNYVIAINNKVGVTVNAPVSMAINGSTGGAGVGSTDPTANLSY